MRREAAQIVQSGLWPSRSPETTASQLPIPERKASPRSFVDALARHCRDSVTRIASKEAKQDDYRNCADRSKTRAGNRVRSGGEKSYAGFQTHQGLPGHGIAALDRKAEPLPFAGELGDA